MHTLVYFLSEELMHIGKHEYRVQSSSISDNFYMEMLITSS